MATRRGFLGTATAVSAATLLTSSKAYAVDDAPAAAAVTEKEARDSILAVNVGMRANYAALKAELIKVLSPVMVVQNDNRGGKFTLIHGGTQEAVQPVDPIFELAKSIAHVPLGIFTILAPYLSDKIPNIPNAARIDPHDLEMTAYGPAGGTGWITPLQDFQKTMTTAKGNLKAAGLPAQLATSCDEMINKANVFIDAAVKTKQFDMKSYQDFSKAAFPNVEKNMYWASKAQIAGVQALMKKWRAQIGEAAWSDMYVGVLSQWTTSVLNQNTIIIGPCMDAKKVATHLIDFPTTSTPADPVFTVLDNIARIVQDNIAAELVFVSDTEIADALKGKQDLLSTEILDQLKTPSAATEATTAAFTAGAGATAAKCPFSQKAAQV
ncbi:hypothetical protein [Streptomyces sp. NPDC101150]|uniref:hypothetical protein n=1 Tax=Streptomyces sp. NPDC101150 TaxID=3366114 RepID=UPI0038156C31